MTFRIDRFAECRAGMSAQAEELSPPAARPETFENQPPCHAGARHGPSLRMLGQEINRLRLFAKGHGGKGMAR
jgi:hypothetical protein